MDISIENPAALIPEIGELLRANWAETGFDFAFNPDCDAYQRMFDAGICFAVAARRSGQVVGYCSVMVAPHPYNPDVRLAATDALFVHPTHRNGITAGRLIQAAEREAQARGATRISWHCRAGTATAVMLTRHGYTPADIVVIKELNHGH